MVEVLLVHRPRLDDWSLPKGKLSRREHPLVAAAREVHEETAIRPSLGARLPTVSYPVRVDGFLVEKVVDYWSMTVAADEGFATAAAAGSEVDGIAWLAVEQARQRLTYPRDHSVLEAFARVGPLPTPILFVRHASADPAGWHGDDVDRPLDHAGRARAEELAVLLDCFTPGRLVSASPLRCRQTLEPLAVKARLRIEVDGTFDESARPDVAARRLRALAAEQGERTARLATVVCSQGALMPPALAALGNGSAGSFATAKGDGWVVSFRDGGVEALDELR